MGYRNEKSIVILTLILFATVRHSTAQGENNTSPIVTTQSTVPSTGKVSTERSTQTVLTSTLPVTTTQSTEELCAKQNNKSCDDCMNVPGAKCLWCSSNSRCTAYPVRKIIPSSDICALDKARWGVCWVNFEALIIACSVVGGILVLSCIICTYCCCCRTKSSRKYDKEDARYDAQKMERKTKNDERRAERKERLDEIRRKYGLMKDEPYQRFDA